MAASASALDLWSRFRAVNRDVRDDAEYQVWYFGNTPEMASELAELVLIGRKTATASLAATDAIKPDEAPFAYGYSIVTDFYGEPVCVVQTVEIRHLPFAEVDAQFAFDEGEGDRSLSYWRSVHHEYFSREAALLGIDLDERSIVCCERFILLYPK